MLCQSFQTLSQGTENLHPALYFCTAYIVHSVYCRRLFMEESFSRPKEVMGKEVTIKQPPDL